MINSITLWQSEGQIAFILADTGTSRMENGVYRPVLINDFTVRVESNSTSPNQPKTEPGRRIRANLLAAHIAKLLNEHPFMG